MPRRNGCRITKRRVDALRPRQSDYMVWDRDLPGFGVRVAGTGRKVYVVQTRGPGGSRRHSIAAHGEMTAQEARKAAKEALARIGEGLDPGGEEAEPELTVAELARRYMRLHVAVNCKPGTVELYQGAIDTHIVPAMGERPITAIGTADAEALHYALHDRPAAANLAVQVLAQMYRKAAQWHLADNVRNPCRTVRRYRARPRTRYLTGEEYRRLGRVLNEGEADGSFYESAVTAIRLLILTGCRRDEILTLRWDDVDFDAREIRLRDSKTGPCLVALTSAAQRVLDGALKLPGNPWVIVGEAPGRRLRTLKSTWARVKRRAGLEGVRLHDLRHSYASRALALGENLTVIGKLMNHARVQSTVRYAHLMTGAERDAAVHVGDAISAQIAGQGARSALRRKTTRRAPWPE